MPEYIVKGKAKEAVDFAVELSKSEYDMMCDAINRIPAADVAPVVHGRWISKKNPNWPAYSHDWCSQCGWWNTKNAQCYETGHRPGHSLNYCPNCGAKMDLEDDK